MAKDPKNPTIRNLKKAGLLEEILYPEGRPMRRRFEADDSFSRPMDSYGEAGDANPYREISPGGQGGKRERSIASGKQETAPRKSWSRDASFENEQPREDSGFDFDRELAGGSRAVNSRSQGWQESGADSFDGDSVPSRVSQQSQQDDYNFDESDFGTPVARSPPRSESAPSSWSPKRAASSSSSASRQRSSSPYNDYNFNGMGNNNNNRRDSYQRNNNRDSSSGGGGDDQDFDR
jgi:hypothetical protein